MTPLIDMAMLFGWVLFFYLLSRWTFARGLERYSGFGG